MNQEGQMEDIQLEAMLAVLAFVMLALNMTTI